MPHIRCGAQRKNGRQKYTSGEGGGLLCTCEGSGGYHHICKFGVSSSLPFVEFILKSALLNQTCWSGGKDSFHNLGIIQECVTSSTKYESEVLNNSTALQNIRHIYLIGSSGI